MTKIERSGLSMLELLVTLALLSIVVSISLSAIHVIRESSRKTACINKLRQIGVAIHGFESRQNSLPNLAIRSLHFESGRFLRTASVHYDLLSDLELANLSAETIPNHLVSGIFDILGQPKVTNHPLVSTPIAVFQCPSDGFQGIGTNYRFCTGPDAHSSLKPAIREGLQGAFGSMKRNPLSRFTRGMSNIVFASERNRSNGADRSAKSAAWLASFEPPFPVRTQQFIDVSQQSLVFPPSDFFPFNGHYWIQSGYDCTLFNSVFAPNSRVYSLFSGRLDPDTGNGAIMTATANHTGGVVTLYGDGAVLLTSEMIDLNTWQTLATCDVKQ